MNNLTDGSVKKIVLQTIEILESKKAVDIKIMKIDRLTSLADYFIICNGTSTTQIKTLADEVEIKLKNENFQIFHREGYNSGNWILLDYGFMIVHIFHKEMREFYNLEKLWADGELTDIDELRK